MYYIEQLDGELIKYKVELDVERLTKEVEVNEELLKEEPKPTELPKKEKNNKKEEITEEKIDEKEFEEIKKEEEIFVEQPQQTQEENILTTMPIVDKIGSVVPVNVFESLKKTGEKLPDVVLPSNGLKDDQNDIFVDTKDLFE